MSGINKSEMENIRWGNVTGSEWDYFSQDQGPPKKGNM